MVSFRARAVRHARGTRRYIPFAQRTPGPRADGPQKQLVHSESPEWKKGEQEAIEVVPRLGGDGPACHSQMDQGKG